MIILKSTRVAERLESPLFQWWILETVSSAWRIVGHNQRGCAGRGSSAIPLFDPSALRGAICAVCFCVWIGPDGWAEGARNDWKRWSELNNLESYRGGRMLTEVPR
jgi:hypothetical protein